MARLNILEGALLALLFACSSTDDVAPKRDALPHSEPDLVGVLPPTPDSSAPDSVAESDLSKAPDTAKSETMAEGDTSTDAADRTPDSFEEPPRDAVETDAATDFEAVDCPPNEPFDYSCNPDVPATCPEGICLYGVCLAPVLDPDRHADCGDGVCGPCQSAADCPADCAPPPSISGPRDYQNDTTITVWLHGFSTSSKTGTYALDQSCSRDLFDHFPEFGIELPCGDNPEGNLLPNQIARASYFGDTPPEWMAPEHAEEIARYPWDGPTALHRYGLIMARFIRYKLEVSSATHVNIACHSFGCLIARYIIEHNLAELASERRIARWFTSGGVIAGARLARFATHPDVLRVADLIGIGMYDFLVMNPDFVMDEVAAWDHRHDEGNSPYLQSILIHHVAGSDQRVRPALNLPLLDLLNPYEEPNDGIMFSLDQFFSHQRPSGAFTTPSGAHIPATHSFTHAYHEDISKTAAFGVLGTAGLFHRRKVFIRLAEIELHRDRESRNIFDGEQGRPPAEVSVEARVYYRPYVNEVLERDVLIHELAVDQRTPDMFIQEQGTTLQPNLTIFEGPVFDEMTSLHLDLEVVEVDWYPRFEVREARWPPHAPLGEFSGDVPLENGTFEFETRYARCVISVEVVDMY